MTAIESQNPTVTHDFETLSIQSMVLSNDNAWSPDDEVAQVNWLIIHFNHLFAHHHVVLVRGNDEPEYIPTRDQAPARIQFAHGFFNSALHEISHWCIAGRQRRTLPDLGYWYAPDGRSREQQALFEQVEIKPQALEWLLARACNRPFRVSLDNLHGETGDGQQFKDAVFAQVQRYLKGLDKIPTDAQRLIEYCCRHIRANKPLNALEFERKALD